MLLATAIFFRNTRNKCFFLPYSNASVWFACFRSSHQKVFWKMPVLQTILQINLWKSFKKTLSHFLLIDQKLEENWFGRTHVDDGYFWYFQTTCCNISILVWQKEKCSRNHATAMFASVKFHEEDLIPSFFISIKPRRISSLQLISF